MTELTNILGVVPGIDTGFINYETWAVSLWIGTGEGAFKYWKEEAQREKREARDCAQVREQLGTEEDVARFRLADRMMRKVCDGAPITEDGLHSDLLRLALARVDWLQVADEYLALPEFPT